MFQTAVPVMLSTIPEQGMGAYLENLMKQIHGIRAERVYLCPDLPGELDVQCRKIDQVARILHTDGLWVGVWIASIGHVSYAGMGFPNMVDLDGEAAMGLTCPSHPGFQRFFGSLCAQLAACDIEELMLDDDFRINFNTRKPLCFCEEHLRRISQELGETVSRQQLREQLLTGANNRYRAAWQEVNRQLLLEFARSIRSEVDAVKPTLPVTLASGPALWGLDTGDPLDIARILAGDRPFAMRLSGAPYWPFFFSELHMPAIIEYIRRESAYCRRAGIATYAEGDTYPRPRYEMAASQLELYELACRADGNMDGILKYVFDYRACATYETGYVQAAMKNLDLYQAVDQSFSGKKPVGLSVFSPFAMGRSFLGRAEDTTPDMETACVYLPELQMVTDCGIPCHYEPEGAGLVFGDTALELPEDRLGDGWILDLPAAMALTRRGVDVGLREDLGLFQQEESDLWLEHDKACLLQLNDQEFAPISSPDIHRLRTAEGAELLSTYVRGAEYCPGEYRYENARGQRFVVFPFDAYREQYKLGMFRNYYRQRQLIEAFRWLSGRPLEAVCVGHPGLYLLVKKDSDSITVGLWNFSLDSIDAPVVELAESYHQLEAVRCTGTLTGNRVALSRLGAQEFCCFTAKKLPG